MTDTTNGNGGNRLLSLDQANRNAKDAHGRHLRHNATVLDVYQIVAEETGKVHEHYLNQIPAFTARMIQDALVSYGLIKLTGEALAASDEPVMPENAAGDMPEPDSNTPPMETTAP